MIAAILIVILLLASVTFSNSLRTWVSRSLLASLIVPTHIEQHTKFYQLDYGWGSKTKSGGCWSPDATSGQSFIHSPNQLRMLPKFRCCNFQWYKGSNCSQSQDAPYFTPKFQRPTVEETPDSCNTRFVHFFRFVCRQKRLTPGTSFVLG